MGQFIILNEGNIEQIMKAGWSRWGIENETFVNRLFEIFYHFSFDTTLKKCFDLSMRCVGILVQFKAINFALEHVTKFFDKGQIGVCFGRKKIGL